jgi:general secretion pathway protein F
LSVFDYKAYDKKGRIKKGSITGDTERHARGLLKEQGLLATEINIVSESTQQSFFSRKIQLADLSLIMRQLSTLINSGLPLEDSLRLMIEQSDTAIIKRTVMSWRSEIIEGRSFSQALKRSPFKVPESVIASVAVGEESGHLHRILDRVADELEVGMENRQALTKGLVYPAVMILVAVTVVIIMLVYVVPQVTRVFTSMKQELPLLTKIMIALSEWLQSYGIFAFIFIVAAVGFFVFSLRDKERKKRWHKFLLGIPKIGGWLMIADVADWCRNLGTLLNSGVPALPALNISAAIVNNLYLRDSFYAVNERVRQGSSLYNALREEPGMPGFLLHMVSSGEASSELDTMLVKVAEYYSSRLRRTVDTLLKLLEPLLVVVMGGIVLLIVGAVLVPIIEMNQMI